MRMLSMFDFVHDLCFCDFNVLFFNVSVCVYLIPLT